MAYARYAECNRRADRPAHKAATSMQPDIAKPPKARQERIDRIPLDNVGIRVGRGTENATWPFPAPDEAVFTIPSE
jgi:hypothetical protein